MHNLQEERSLLLLLLVSHDMWTHRNHRSRRRRSNTETKKEKGGSSMRAPKKRIHHHQARPSPSRSCWLMESCPPDVFPKIMAFVGPESFSVFPQVHGFFQHLLEQDSTWKVLCEELYKVRSTPSHWCWPRRNGEKS